MKRSIFIWLSLFVFIHVSVAQSDERTKGLKKITPERERPSKVITIDGVDLSSLKSLKDLEKLADIDIDIDEHELEALVEEMKDLEIDIKEFNYDLDEVDFDMSQFEHDMERFAEDMAEMSAELGEMDFDFHDIDIDLSELNIDMSELQREIHRGIEEGKYYYRGVICDDDEHDHSEHKSKGQKRVRE